MYGPAVRCKRTSSSWRRAVLHQCIRPFVGASAPGHHGYQRACELITGKASTGPFGSPVFASAGKTEPPSRLILSQTSAGNWTSCECSRGLKPRFKNAAVSQHAPGDAGQLVGERDRKHVAVQSLLGCLDPVLEAMALPALRLNQHDPRGLHEQNAQIAIAAF